MNVSVYTLSPSLTLHFCPEIRFATEHFSFHRFVDRGDSDTAFAMLPSLLREGCLGYESYQAISEKLRLLYGAELTCDSVSVCDKIDLTFSMNLLLPNALPGKVDISRDALALLYDLIYHPHLPSGNFDPEKIRRCKNSYEAVVRGLRATPTYAGERLLLDKISTQNPVLKPLVPGLKDIRNVTAEQLLSAWQSQVASADMHVFYCGARSVEEVKALLAPFIAACGKPSQSLPTCQTLAYTDERPFRVVRHGKQELSTVHCLWKIDLDTTSPLWKAGKLYEALFGSGMNPISRLYTTLREKEGLCYECAAHMSRGYSYLYAFAQVRHGTEMRTVSCMRDLAEGMKSPCHAYELDATREFLQNVLLSAYDSAEAKEKLHLTNWLLGMDGSIRHIQEGLSEIDAETLMEFASHVTFVGCSINYGGGGR